MDALKVFISHSSKDDTNLTLLRQVCDALDHAGYDVLVDKGGRIPVGDEWFLHLAEWMAECDAAVILFSRAAFEASEWVRAEAAILSWRKRIQPDFKLIGVPLDDVDPGEFAQDSFFNVIRINDFQFVRDCGNDRDQIVAKIIPELGVPNADALEAPLAELCNQIRELLNMIDSTALKRAWNVLNHEHKPSWEPGLDFADALARALLRDPKNSLNHLKNLLKKLAHLPISDEANKLLTILRGLWVDPEAAATLTWVRNNRLPASINGVELEHFTAPSYARRAWAFPSINKIISAGDKWTIEDIGKNLLNHFEGATPHRAKQKLKRCTNPVILVFPYPEHGNEDREQHPEHGLLEEIKETYPNVTILIATGDTAPDDLHAYITLLEPPLEPNEEETQYGHYEDIEDLIKNQIAGELP